MQSHDCTSHKGRKPTLSLYHPFCQHTNICVPFYGWKSVITYSNEYNPFFRYATQEPVSDNPICTGFSASPVLCIVRFYLTLSIKVFILLYPNFVIFQASVKNSFQPKQKVKIRTHRRVVTSTIIIGAIFR